MISEISSVSVIMKGIMNMNLFMMLGSSMSGRNVVMVVVIEVIIGFYILIIVFRLVFRVFWLCCMW